MALLRTKSRLQKIPFPSNSTISNTNMRNVPRYNITQQAVRGGKVVVNRTFLLPAINPPFQGRFLSLAASGAVHGGPNTRLGGMDELAVAAAVVAKSIDDFAEEDLEQRRLCGVAAGDGGQTLMLLVLSG